MMQSTEVTICLMTYNRPKMLEEAIRSILAQSWENFSLVILDNASTLDYQDVLDKFSDERISYIRHETNLGSGGNAEYAHKNFLTTQYFMMFHDDDIMHPRLLEHQVRLLKEQSDICWVGPISEKFQGKVPKYGLSIRGDTLILNSTSELADLLIRKLSICIGHVLMRTTAYKQIDLVALNEELFGLADRPTLFQLMRNGKAAVLLETLAFYRVHPNQHSIVTKWSVKNIINLGRHYKMAMGKEATFGQRWRLRFSDAFNFINSFKECSDRKNFSFWEFYRLCHNADLLFWWSLPWYAIKKILSFRHLLGITKVNAKDA